MTTKATPVKTKPAPLLQGIFAALAAIQQDISAIPKDSRNDAQNFNFRGIDAIYNSLHPIFAAHGVVVIPTVLETTFERWLNAKQNNTFAARVKVRYDFTASDGSTVPAVGVGEAYDFGDKALNKAMSMAHKYVLLQMFQIPTSEPDGDAYDYTQSATATQQQTEQPDPYAGKTLDQLTILRDEYLDAKQQVPGELLGKISELKCAQEDEIPDVKPKRQPRANGKAAKAAEDAKPVEPAPVNRVTPVTPAHVTTPRAEQDLAPGAVEQPEPDEFGEPADDGFGDAASQTKLDAALNFVITPELLKHPKYAGRKLSSLSGEEIATLHEKWYLKFQADIDATPAKATLRDALLTVKAEWDKAAKK